MSRVPVALASGTWVVFFLSDERPARIREAAAFREAALAFEEWGASLLAVGRGSAEELAAFRRRFELPFEVTEDVGVTAALGMAPGASVTLRDGRVTRRSEAHGVGHVERVLAALSAPSRRSKKPT